MKKAWVLSKLYINSLYGISGFFNNLKVNRKDALKKIVFILLMAFAFSGSIGLFVTFNVKMYDYLKEINQQSVIITLTIIIASLMTLVFGMLGIITTYFVDKEGDIVLSMPIKAWQILSAKFASNYVYEAIVSLVIMATGFMVYGIKSGASPIFYIICLIVAALVPLIPLTIGYFVVIPLMRAGSILRKKDFTMILSGAIAIIFAVGIQYLTQLMVKTSTNPAAMAMKLVSKDGLVSLTGKIYYPSIWATYAITRCSEIGGFINLIVFAGISLSIVVLLVNLMSGVYAVSIVGSQEVNKSKKYSEGTLREKLKGKGILVTLLDREIKLMNREPVFFLNGPLVIIIMPLIFGFALFMQKGDLSKQLESLSRMNNSSYYITLALAGISIFLGISVNITSTCISREGKAFDLLKSMPIEPKKYILAKLIHGLIFGVLATAMCIVIGEFIFGIGFASGILILIISLAVMLPVLIAGIIIEFAWPKLLWDNPRKAMKQNMNGVIVILGSMCLIGLLGYLVLGYLKEPSMGYITLIIAPILISIILYNFLMKYGDKRFYEIEM